MVQRYDYEWMYEKIKNDDFKVLWYLSEYENSKRYQYVIVFVKEDGMTVTLDIATIQHWQFYYKPRKMPQKLLNLIRKKGLDDSRVLKKLCKQKRPYILKVKGSKKIFQRGR